MRDAHATPSLRARVSHNRLHTPVALRVSRLNLRHLGKAYPERSIFVNAGGAYHIFPLDTVVRRSARIRTVDAISRDAALDHVPDWCVGENGLDVGQCGGMSARFK